MMLTPWGPSAVPTGGAGVAAPAWSCTLTSAAIFFLGGIPVFSLYLVVMTGLAPLPPVVALSSDLLDLGEAQLDRGLPAEDLDEGLDPLCLGVDLGDRRVQRGERAVHDHDRVGHVEVRDRHLLARGRLGGCTTLGLGSGGCLRPRPGGGGGHGFRPRPG